MEKIIIHAGPHKTGSTYIQKLLHNEKALLLKNKISYPNAYYLFLGHHYLLNALNGPEKEKTILSTIIEATNSCNNLILSSENFIFLTHFGLQKLKNTFPNVDFTFILYIRRPSLRLISWWQETIKQGSIRPFEDYFLNHVLNPMKSREINMLHYINDIISLFGENSIKLIDYDTAVKEKKMMKSFWIAANLPNLIVDKDEKVNEMMPLAEIELIRYMNIRATQDTLLKGANVREIYMQLRKHFAQQIEILITYLETTSPRKIILGNCSFDHTIIHQLNTKLNPYLVNEISLPEEKEYLLPNVNWMFEAEILEQLDQIYLAIRTKLKSL